MLILARRLNESIIVGDTADPILKIKIIAIRGDIVHLGFEADRSVLVNREEVAERIVKKCQ